MDKVPQPIRSFLLMTGLILATNTPGLDSQEEECQTIPCLTAKASGLKEDLNTCEASLNTESAKLAAAILEGQQCTEKTDGLSRRLSEAEAKLPPLGEAAEKLRVVRDRQPENSQISSGIMLAGDVFLGIYQTHPSLTLEAPLSGITQFNLIVKPHVFTGNRQLSKDREFFIRAELINPKAQALSVKADSTAWGTDPRLPVCKIFPTSPDTCASWRISRRDRFGYGDYETRLRAWLGSRPAHSTDAPVWDEEREVTLEPQVVIRIPYPTEVITTNITTANGFLSLIGGGGVLGILVLVRTLLKSPKEKKNE